MLSQKEAAARARKVFNAASDFFDAPALSFWNYFGQKTIDRLMLPPGARVLDVCCGTGASAIPAAKRVGITGMVLGIDLAESLLSLAQEKALQEGLTNIEFRAGDFADLGFPDACFDAVVCVFGIFFVPDMIGAIKELLRMLRPHGKLAITSWGEKVFEPANQIFWELIAKERPDLYKKLTPWDRIVNPISLQALLEAGGATQVEVVTEAVFHELASPEDWWTMVLGGGMRGTIDQLDPDTKEHIRQANIEQLKASNIRSLAVEVLYATGHKRA